MKQAKLESGSTHHLGLGRPTAPARPRGGEEEQRQSCQTGSTAAPGHSGPHRAEAAKMLEAQDGARLRWRETETTWAPRGKQPGPKWPKQRKRPCEPAFVLAAANTGACLSETRRENRQEYHPLERRTWSEAIVNLHSLAAPGSFTMVHGNT